MTSAHLIAGWNAARQAWPAINVPPEAFASYVQTSPRLGASEARASARWADLYIACGCLQGNAAALAAFERAYFPGIDAALIRIGVPGSSLDEMHQLVRYQLFIGDTGERPKIESYSGRGDLGAWVRIIATRIAINIGTRLGRETSADDDGLAFLIGGGEDPELQYMKRMYTAEFRTAFRQAFGELDAKAQTLLRYAFCDRLNIDAIGALFRVHRSTAARWVASAHATLVEHVKEAFASRLGVDTEDYASILRMIRSQLETSLDQYLRDP